MVQVSDFDAIRISLASPSQIRSWSYGEVLKPETINYRTLRPERDGLFCERIFGPTKDWECYCGKYKRVRFRGVVCEKCGVEVAPARVRRERMGHIELASPVSHIWYVKGVPSRIGLLLNISPRKLERVLYFAQHIVTRVDEQARSRTLQRHERDLAIRLARLEGEMASRIGSVENERDEALLALDEEEAARLAELEQQLDAATGEVMGQASAVQSSLEERQGRKIRKPILLPWREEPLAEAGETIGREHVKRLTDAVQARLNEIEAPIRQQQEEVRQMYAARRDLRRRQAEEEIETLRQQTEEQKEALRQASEAALAELKELAPLQLLTEARYQELHARWGGVFEAAMGAEAIRDILSDLDLDKMAQELRQEIASTRSMQRRRKAVKRLQVVEAFRKSGNKPEWMILTVLPVIPPELRPMVQLDGGRFATSDLNDLYRRVINRNNRLRRLIELGAPDVIIRNEKRMLQEAVDSLIDNSRRGRAVSRSGKRELKSLSDLLKGKQGRFRRNLLGKRVDYSGRSVIVVGPELKLHQCGLPKTMALELFKPFVMRRLVEQNYVQNIKSAKRAVERSRPEVWEVLEEVVKERPVLLNRAPTLHRLGFQAFEVVLTDGYAIRIHPLVCAAFNADFDGDQMAVHVPLSDQAVKEAREFMLSSHNLLKPANGEPIVGPSKDMVLGCYYMTSVLPKAKGEGRIFADFDELRLAYDLGQIDLRALIKVRFQSVFDEEPLAELGLSERVLKALQNGGLTTVGQVLDRLAVGRGTLLEISGFGPAALKELEERLAARNLPPRRWPRERLLETTVGRVIFNESLPPELHFVNETLDKKGVSEVVAECYQRLGEQRTVEVVDAIKKLGFEFATRSGLSIAISDIRVPETKADILARTEELVEKTERQYRRGLITEEEQYNKVIELWTRASDEIAQEVRKYLDPVEGLGAMVASGATKGGIQPIRQLAGMRGLMADPSGRIIALPIRSNFREGLDTLEYFLSTHGARKGLADTALRTADAGYLTRRLVDVAQDVIVTMEDCGTSAGIWIDRKVDIGESFAERIMGRVAAQAIVHPETGEVLVAKGQLISEQTSLEVEKAGVPRVYVRSPLACEASFGVCSHCYGQDLARGGLVKVGEAVGIIAAQSIGEPGTQLTLRTFHTGGVAGTEDITQGLPRVEELLEARSPRGEAVISEIDGLVDVYWDGEERKIKVTHSHVVQREHLIPAGYDMCVEIGDRVQEDTVIARGRDGTEPSEILAGIDGHIFWEETDDGARLAVARREETEVWETPISPTARLHVEKGQWVQAGEQLTEGPKNPKEVLRIQGDEACQLYLLEEVQRVYRSQGVLIHDKHIEIIIRQMLRWVRIRSGGDTSFLPGELVDRFQFREVNEQTLAVGGQPAEGRVELLGLTKASLNASSFLSAASFQETTRVLTAAAVRGDIDELRGLKENVIIGKLIPVGSGFRVRQRRKEEKAAEAPAFGLAAEAVTAEMLGEEAEAIAAGQGLHPSLARALARVEKEEKAWAGFGGSDYGDDEDDVSGIDIDLDDFDDSAESDFDDDFADEDDDV
ncbi:MAG: DNA-directed RNA polymerase subunit beta' [Anaerolineae bacterium]|nr:DNA-directed RNA polymerase subunit beta' [Anaerolineae bacterium]